MLSKKSKAIGFIIMSAFGFAMMAAFVRLAGDLPFTQKTFFRNLVAVAVAAVVLCREKVGFKWEKGNLPLLIIRATCGTLGIFCNYYAIDHLVLADANILNKMSPFFAIIFSLILLKERASVFQYAAVLAAFGSSMLIIKPGFSSATFPAIIGLLGGMGAGAAYTCVRALSRKGEKERPHRVLLLDVLHAGMRTVYDHGLPPNDMGTVLLPDRRRCVSRARTVRRNARVRQRTGQGDFGVRLHAGHLLGCPRLFPVRPAAGRLERPRLSADLRHFGRGVLLQPQSGAQGTVI